MAHQTSKKYSAPEVDVAMPVHTLVHVGTDEAGVVFLDA